MCRINELLEWDGIPDPAAEAERLFRAMRSPDARTMPTILRRLAFLPPELGGPLLHDLYERQVDRTVFQLLLVMMWRQFAAQLREAAGSREQLLAWFAYADFRDVTLPHLHDWCGLRLLPERFTAWRGGCGFEQDIAAGMSWTLHRPVAAVFIGMQRAAYSRSGKAHLLRREVRREEALAYFDSLDRELVLAAPGPYEVETVEIEELVRISRPALLESRARFAISRERLKLLETDAKAWLNAAVAHKLRFQVPEL
jgi:hypothetical protein